MIGACGWSRCCKRYPLFSTTSGTSSSVFGAIWCDNGAAERAGSVARVPAAEVEAAVVKSVREHIRSQRAIDDRILIETYVVRVEVHTAHLTIKLAQAESEDDDTRLGTVLSVLWQKMASTRRREILVPEGTAPQAGCSWALQTADRPRSARIDAPVRAGGAGATADGRRGAACNCPHYSFGRRRNFAFAPRAR